MQASFTNCNGVSATNAQLREAEIAKIPLLISAALSNYRVTIRRRLRAVAPSELDLTGD